MNAPLDDVPPEMPTELAALDRAITLLGERVKADLRQKHQAELARLLGCYPDAPTAAAWKSVLKRIRQEELPVLTGSSGTSQQ